MPEGIFLVVHDDIKGPKLRCSYFKDILDLPQEFISKLYMSHAGFESSSSMELKFDRYRIVSAFTGSLDRRTQKEGILGIVFEEHEDVDNLDLFLQRNLNYAIDNPDQKTMKDIFLNKLIKYLELTRILNKIEIERIPELFIIKGEDKFTSCSLKIVKSRVSNTVLSELFEKIIKNQDTAPYQYELLKSEGSIDTFFIIKIDKPDKDTEKVVKTMISYLQKFMDYSLEILVLCLLPSEVGIIPLKSTLFKKYSQKEKSVLEILKKSKNYQNDFNNLITSMMRGDIYLSSLL